MKSSRASGTCRTALDVCSPFDAHRTGREGSQPNLSPEQLDAGVEWKQPANFWVDPTQIDSEDIAQRIADCSLHASIVVALGHSRRFNADHSVPHLRACSDGFILDIFFNGCRRRVRGPLFLNAYQRSFSRHLDMYAYSCNHIPRS